MSREYITLQGAIADLTGGLMSFAQRVDGAYTPEEMMKCQAFIVFTHAEVENYLEKIARRIMSEAKSRWDTNPVPDRVIATLLAFRRKEVIGPPESIKSPNNRSCIKKIVEEAIKLHDEAITDNNGIKERNVGLLLLPLGVLAHDVEENLLIQLTNIGSKRGELVHRQSRLSLPLMRDPFADEKQDVDNLIAELGVLDAHLETLGLLAP